MCLCVSLPTFVCEWVRVCRCVLCVWLGVSVCTCIGDKGEREGGKESLLGSLEADCWPEQSLRPTVPASGRRLTEPRNLRRKRRDATSTRWNRREPTVDFGPSTDRSAMKLCHRAECLSSRTARRPIPLRFSRACFQRGSPHSPDASSTEGIRMRLSEAAKKAFDSSPAAIYLSANL